MAGAEKTGKAFSFAEVKVEILGLCCVRRRRGG